MTKKRQIYFDNAATTPLLPSALEAMMPYLTEVYGNPSSLYSGGLRSRRAIREARESMAAVLGCNPSELYFTSCGTEANNWAIKMTAREARVKGLGRHLITSAIEHHATLHSMKQLEPEGFVTTLLPCDHNAVISVDALKEALRPDSLMLSVMLANNETGTLEPVRELCAIAKEKGLTVHVDAVQAVGHISVDVQDLGVDMLSLSAHKFGGPKGVGALYIRKGTELASFISGGAQERMRRAGTENVAGIVGMAAALEASAAIMEAEAVRISSLRDRAWEIIKRAWPSATPHAAEVPRLPGHLNLTLPGLSSEDMILALDDEGIAVSAGSACSSGSPEPSHVLTAMKLPFTDIQSSLRLSFGHVNTEEDLDDLERILPNVLAEMSS